MRTESAERIDNAINTLFKLKGMFGAVIYLINPDGTRLGDPSENFENWFADIRDKLDDAIDTLSKT